MAWFLGSTADSRGSSDSGWTAISADRTATRPARAGNTGDTSADGPADPFGAIAGPSRTRAADEPKPDPTPGMGGTIALQ
ncbi:hypothetical protein [Bifidobacterium miconisargentati]|uniref:hypothetical protein n=1 Tax=Bifidobacterium miconisargentati TaxID=2834437 RepID=UPI001BDD860A|nr:hypothetical protein [Bifidobacterium miconisargentati]MBW3090307.1 hypothetical protein [Bifidobacterium miconisargentati]